MIFKHCSLIQEGEAVLFYRYNRILKGYVISGVLIASNAAARVAFGKIWKYFVSEVVQADDIYCSLVPTIDGNIFSKYVHFHCEVDGLKIYKVDTAIKEKYSMYAKHLKDQTNG